MQPKPQPKGLKGLLFSIARGFDLTTRLIFNFVFLLLVVLFVAALFSEPTVVVPSRAALVIDPQGYLVEQLSGDPVSRAVDEAMGEFEAETLVDDVLAALAAARDDDRIEAVYFDLDGLLGGGLDKLKRIKEEIATVRAAGKPVIATGDSYTEAGYMLASAADEIYLHPLGLVLIDGYGRYRTYYAEGLEKLGVEPNVFRVGTFKSAVEPLLRDSMSDEAKEANLDWLGDLWGSYLTDAAASRELEPARVASVATEIDSMVAEHGGDFAQVVVELGLVDQLAHPDEVRQRMIELVGEDPAHDSFRQIHFSDYLQALGGDAARFPTGGEGVGVVVASGEILDGEQPPGTIGGVSTAELVRRARHDDDIRALVLRVDSGGGSAFASELIRREVELVREAGKPVVVSMGTLAASGGYWISTSSDEIWAHADTLTGSIGIFGSFPTFQKPLEKYLGMRVDGVGTTWLAGALRPDRALDPRAGAMIQSLIERGYDEFLERVSNARDMTVEDVDAIAQGRVWSGRDALDLGLVDRLGTLDEAIASAAALAELEEGYAVRVIEPELDWIDQLAVDLLEADSRAGSLARTVLAAVRPDGLPTELMRHLEEPRHLLEAFNDPRGLYAYCGCDYD
ncbi:MAG: signal peptide peptidase SppA [Acidobacteriota bacterium]